MGANNFHNTRGKGKNFSVLPWILSLMHKPQEEESLNTKPSPLAASKSSSSKELRPRPRKRAVLIAVSYKNQKFELKGTINDVKKMKKWLVGNFGFKPENILILTEEEKDEELKPTKKNIRISMEWLMKDCLPGDSLVFFFSGHGLRQPDFEKDERDGWDESICPVDYFRAGLILDNEIYSTIVHPLPKDVTLHAIIDACHSGTVLDLSYVYSRKTKKWEDNSPPSGAKKFTSGGLAISIGACRDDQMAADTNAFNEADSKMSGALTHTLISNVEEGQRITYGELLDKIYSGIEEADKQGCLASRILRTLLKERLLQEPQLSASEPFNVYEKRFIL